MNLWQCLKRTKYPHLAPRIHNVKLSRSLEDVASSLRQENPPTPSIGQVKTALKQLNSKKATGSDGIPAWVLKRYCEELAPIIHDIICASIKQCEYPTACKHALVIPVPKVNPPRDIENDFRQISILPQMAKVLEKLQLKLNLPSSRINDNQHAFMYIQANDQPCPHSPTSRRTGLM